MPQTGGGCRASNYIHLLRKALEKNGYGYHSGHLAELLRVWRSNPGFKLTQPMLIQMAYAAV